MFHWFRQLRAQDPIVLVWRVWAWVVAILGIMVLIGAGVASLAILVWLVPALFAWSVIRARGDGRTPYAYAAPRLLLAEVRIILRRVGRVEADELRRTALVSAQQAWQREHGDIRPGRVRRDGSRTGGRRGLRVLK